MCEASSTSAAQNIKKVKKLNDPRGEPVWIRLEREMQENIDKKPYNEIVGKWLAWLKDFKAYQHRQGLKIRKEIANDVGPPWFCEFSNQQRSLLASLKTTIHEDLVDRLPSRTRQALVDIGITCKLPRAAMLKAMDGSCEDPGIFVWNLYRIIFNRLPTELLPNNARYGINEMLLMSAMVFIDLKECIEQLELLTYADEPVIKPVKKKPCKGFTPDVKLGPYLQTFCVPRYTPQNTQVKHMRRPFEHKVMVRTPEEYEELRLDLSFLKRRKARNMKTNVDDRKCLYPFWIPPPRNPKLPNQTEGAAKDQDAEAMIKMKMLKKRATPKFKAPHRHEQYLIGTVVFCQNTPQYLLGNLCILPTGYTPITHGVVQVKELGLITSYSGQWTFPPKIQTSCDKTCDCVSKWEGDVMTYLKETKCKCGHYYDFNHKGKATEKYFYQPTQYHPWWLDRAKIFQMDPIEDFIKECVALALKSESTGPSERIHVKATGLSDSELLAVFFADLKDSCLIIPHLPRANFLNTLLNWTRNRVRGPLTPFKRRQLDFKALRRWMQLSHIQFKASPYRIPFTYKELHNMTWAHRSLIQKLYNILLHNFLIRNRLAQLKQSRCWWPTMLPDIYCDEVFREIFFTYMPGRAKDTYLINPYDAFMMVRPNTGNSCPP